jgi:uncharacterized membrane protein (UPF0127 family)
MRIAILDPAGRTRGRLDVEVALTAREQARGLAFRPTVSPGTGMLFLFARDTTRPFTVAQMRAPIDLAWLDASGVVLGTAAHLRPGDPRAVQPPGPYRFVIETAGGALEALGVAAGWRVAW